LKPLVSVVIPTYNRAKYLGGAIESAITQDYPKMEILVMDDGSSDETEEVVKSFSEVKYHYQENLGVALARNNAVKKAGGEVIAFLDSDDRWVKNKLNFQVELMQKLKAPVIGGRKKYVAPDTQMDLDVRVDPEKFHEIGFERQTRRTWFAPSTMLFNKEFYLETGGFDPQLKIASDWDLWLRIAFEKPIPRMDSVLALCYRSRERLTGNRLEKYLHDLKIIKRWEEKLDEETYRRWCGRFAVRRAFKLKQRQSLEETRVFWKNCQETLPLPRYAEIFGRVMKWSFSE